MSSRTAPTGRTTRERSGAPTGRPGRRPGGATTPARGPDPARIAGLLVRAWLEVRAGRRPLAQLAPLVAPAVLRRLQAQLPADGPGHANGPPGRVHRIRASSPAPGVCEAVVTIRSGPRVTAVAVRVEHHLGRWRVTELTAPEAGLRPLPTASLPDGHRPRDAFDEVLDEREGR